MWLLFLKPTLITKLLLSTGNPLKTEEDADENYSDADKEDCKKFWDDVTMEMVNRGCQGHKVNKMTVSPKLSNWAPYIGEKSRIGDIIYNSEHQKVHAEN